MATTRFTSLPAEIHISIAEFCENHDLINLCLTSKRVNERCWPVLYRHVNLRINQIDSSTTASLDGLLDRQQHFVRTMLSHPEYGRHVRYFEGNLCLPTLVGCLNCASDVVPLEDLWRDLRSLTHVRTVDVSSKTRLWHSHDSKPDDTAEYPTNWFQSVTGVRLMGPMPYGLAKWILNAINPATLECLCLDMVQDRKITNYYDCAVPGEMAEDGRIITVGVLPGLLTTLWGRCTAPRTLTLRRIVESGSGSGWPSGADKASYTEWASCICSVRGAVKKFTFEHWPRKCHPMPPASENMDRRFRRMILPAIVSGKLALLDHGGTQRCSRSSRSGKEWTDSRTQGCPWGRCNDCGVRGCSQSSWLDGVSFTHNQLLVTSFIDTIQFMWPNIHAF